ncbi:hypothetical protein K470DRAFT_259268 [Piedraia hortae CBS 480.64]|uniref:DNA excision repair protein n=1 Tax=Piedraia hortae CBS 480.64 TaxID=1314780 RepID=A0A6A7BV76_9PEZI|nr:hypothetical protein K470DRAFT_259268 [Piedraia hortae CBS 480.64]
MSDSEDTIDSDELDRVPRYGKLRTRPIRSSRSITPVITLDATRDSIGKTGTNTGKTKASTGKTKTSTEKMRLIFDNDKDHSAAYAQSKKRRKITAKSSKSKNKDSIPQEAARTIGHRKLDTLYPPNIDNIDFTDDERLGELRERPQFINVVLQREYADVELPNSGGVIPAPIACYLRPYQIEGASFLHRLFVLQEGGILGDDMGLGKTVQVIAFLTAAFGKTGDERDNKRMRKIRRFEDGRWYPRVLIIVPGGLMINWQQELERWGWWHVYSFHGTMAAKQEALAAAKHGRLEIMITTYKTYYLNCGAINEIRWDCVVADEVHQLKENSTEVTKAMSNLNASCRIGLSGTAIQNKYEELWTLLNWTNPGRFGTLSKWKQCISTPLKLGQSHEASYAQLAAARRTAEKLVHNLLPRFFLRRTKALISDQLPKKSDRIVFCPLSEIQTEAYNNFCDSEIVHAIRHSSQPCSCGSGKKEGWCCNAELENYGKWQHYVFPCLMTLQKLANHVAMLVPSGEADESHEKELEMLKEALPDRWKALYQERDNIINFANHQFCGKWRVLKQLLKLWDNNGDKALIFSHSVRLLKILRALFMATTTYSVSYLDGSMSYGERQSVVDDYNTNPSRLFFLISTKAGGVGLNITSANKVVIVDPNWNPSHDLQAQDRAYRIGQVRNVDVFRLVSKGTVEELVYARQVYKQAQANIGYTASVERRYFRGVQDHKAMQGELFGLANLFALVNENVVLRDIINKTNVAESRAGVEIASLDPVEDDERDTSISQLAEDISDDSQPQEGASSATNIDPVSAILATIGVEYTHENAEVIGTSKIETEISARAQKTEKEVRAFGEEAGRFKYQPPVEVRHRQFCSMARLFGKEPVKFALVVEGWSQSQRIKALEQFYSRARERGS